MPGSLIADPIDLGWLFVGNGQALPTNVSPWSGASALRALESLTNSLDGEGLPAIDGAITSLLQDDVPMVDITFNTRFEGYLFSPETESFSERLARIDPLSTLDMSFQADLSLAVRIQANVQREYQLTDLASNLPGPLPGNPVALENNNIQAGYLSYAPGPFTFAFGRQRFSLSPSPLTSLVVSQAVPYLDAAVIGFDLDRLHMTLLTSTLENRAAIGDNQALVTDPYAFSSTIILHNIHYFEYDFGFLRAGIGAQVIITRPQNAFHISDFFPVFSWHNANILPNNLTLTLDLSVVPVPGLEIYAQYGFDDINASLFGADGEIPTIDAGLIGASWRHRGTKASLDTFLEAGFTHYLWGSYNDDVYLSRAIYRLHVDGTNEWIPLNSPYGPGAIWIMAQARLFNLWDLEATATLKFLSRNTLASLTGPYEASDTVANATRDLSLRANFTISYSPWQWLRVSIEPAFVWSDDGLRMELTIGAGTRFTTHGRIGSIKQGAEPRTK